MAANDRDNPADPFKKALAEATRAMANDRELQVSYSVDPPGMSNDSLRLPQVSRRMTRDEVVAARGAGDAYALRMRFHDDAVHNRYLPQGDMARALFEAMETARCEAIGAKAMPGVCALRVAWNWTRRVCRVSMTAPRWSWSRRRGARC